MMVRIDSSPQYRGMLTVLHLLAASVWWVSALPLWAKGAGMVLLGMHAWYVRSVGSPCPAIRACGVRDGRWATESADGSVTYYDGFRVRLDGGFFWRISLQGTTGARSFVLFCDQCRPADLRWLRYTEKTFRVSDEST